MRILFIEDDLEFSDSISYQLIHAGYQIDTCADGADAFYYLDQKAYDLVLLDCLLPHTNGREILTKLRSRKDPTPVIFLTALGELQDKINGLEAGADDYLVKPFAFEELAARIRCISRRPRQWQDSERLCYEDLTYSGTDSTLNGPQGSCTLSKKESALLDFLLRNHAQTLPRQTLLTRVWGPDTEVEDGNLDNYIYFIRRRLKHVGSRVTIKTIRGIGYFIE